MRWPTPAVIFGPMRPPFLLLTPACLAVGVAVAWRAGAALEAPVLLLLAVGGVAAHVAVNALNEYHDARSGLDHATTPTPFSGGSQTLPHHPGWEPVALVVGIAAVLVTAAAGVALLLRSGRELLWVGLPGIVLLGTYTPLLTRNAVLCLLAPGLGFGLLMVAGSAYVVAGEYPAPAWLAALVPFFLVNDLLLLNQLPDREPDRRVGRRHLVIVAGPRTAVRVYAAQLFLAYLAVVVGWAAGWFPGWSLLALATVPLGARATAIASRSVRDDPDVRDLSRLVPALGLNVVVNLLTPTLLAAGLFIGGRTTP
jgi:1,4-dihydroxy-2-naphthoate octaprenyltransferase